MIMGTGLGKLLLLAAAGALVLGTGGAAVAGDCPGNPKALGVSRTIVVDPKDHVRIGTMSYTETLPLRDKEVVLTFDDGPLPPHSDKILDMLAAECIKATYFIVGAMAKAYPHVVQRTYDEGHTIGTHSMTHPYPFMAQGQDRTRQQIDDGIKATLAALGESRKIAPFFRFPGFGRTDSAERYLVEVGLQAWGADVPADDWHKIDGAEVARRALRRLEALGKGIILLHDIHHRTVEALPILLRELKARGYRVVHVLPSAPDRPATVTVAGEWRMRSPVLSAPVFALAEIQDPDGEWLLEKTPAELCSLRPPQRSERRIAKLRIEKPIQDRAVTDGASTADKPGEPKSPEKTREAKVKTHGSKSTESKDKDNKDTPGLLAILLNIGSDSSTKEKSRKDDDKKKKKVAHAEHPLDIHGTR
jgi:peptidoglycan/xylan/chitin deacetylase (PgdA/CDA1 family)